MIATGSALAEQEMIRKSLDNGVQAPGAAMWSYSSVALILGRSQKSSVAMLERAGEEGIDVVVRAAGGGAVIAGPWMCSHTVLVPPDHALARMSLPRSYEAIGEAWRRALSRLGIATDITPPAAAGGRKAAWPVHPGFRRRTARTTGHRVRRRPRTSRSRSENCTASSISGPA